MDEGLRDEEHARRRYNIFQPVELPEVPEKDRNSCLRDLLEFEDSFAITKAEFGKLADPCFDFHVDLIEGAQPCRSKPIRYAPPEWEFINE